MTIADNARAYLTQMPRSISGSGGRTRLFDACAALMRGFSFSEEVAYPIIRDWNATHCEPPWTDRELRQKLREGAKADRAQGYLLKIRTPAQSTLIACDREDAWRREQREKWPSFDPLSEEEIHQIARLRNLPPEAVHAVHLAGLLKAATVNGHRAFIITEATFAQARRFDGQPFERHDGTSIKAKNLPGSKGVFLGASWLGDSTCPILLVEGCIGLLEATAAAQAVDAGWRGWTIIAATSASSRFDEIWLNRLRGRRIRILPDGDVQGNNACGKWSAVLNRIECRVDAFRLAKGLKDLGPLVADPTAHQTIFNQVFTL